MADETAGFDRVNTAQRVRDVIKKLATQQIDVQVPSKLVGRVMSVDLPRLRAVIWFPNDEQPIEVKLLSNAIPGDWQHKSDTNGSYDSLSGYGSQAVVERLNGSLYVTQILTGGQFSFDFRTMNHSIVAQKATPTSAGNTTSIEPIVDQPLETFINCRVEDLTVGKNQGVEFGPFTQYYSGQPGIGFIEMTVSAAPNRGQKYYKFVVNPAQEFDHPGSTGILDSWFRVMPTHSIADSDGTFSGAADWDLDISYKRTAYGNTNEYAGYPEIWFRIIKRTAWSGGLDAMITIRATNIQKARSLGGRELFMQELRTNPAEIHGYIGFHNSKHLYRDTDDFAVFDNFGRTQAVVGAGWGNSDSGQTWLGTTGLWVDGVSGVLSHTAAAQTLSARIDYGLTDYEATWVVWCEQVALGAEFQTQGLFRFLDQNNKYSFKVVFDLLGVIKLSFVQSVAGVHTVLGSDVTLPFTYAANEKLRVRCRIEGGALYGKVWKDGTREPEAWSKTGSSGAIAGGPGYGYGFSCLTGGANSNSRPSNIHFSDVKVYYKIQTFDTGGAQWHTGPWRGGLLRTAASIQKGFLSSVDGISFVSGQLRWERIFLNGAGPHRDGLAAGRISVRMPDNTVQIPIVPTGGTVTKGTYGIPLAAEQSLYVAIPPGADWREMDQYLFIVDGASTRDYQLPEWAVLIASRGPAGNATYTYNAQPEVVLGNGQPLSAWTGLAYRAQWTDYDITGVWQTGQWRMEANNVVRFRGLIKSTIASGGTPSVIGVFADLPIGVAPLYREIQHVMSNGSGTGAARIDFYPDGRIETPLQMNGGGALWIALTGLSFVSNNW